ncbi:MAG TPA: cyclase family protein [Dehalococcoidia bacterium]|nr:cyclase family protein [Dehalococcoidia bacterium]
MPDDLPKYDQLPVREGAPPNSAWGLWGDDDELGCLNLLTPERTTAAANLVRTGECFPLNLRIDRPDPPLYGRGAVRHTITGEGGNGRDDYLDKFWPQASSQWDSLRHIRHPGYGFYNGVPDDQIVAGDTGRLGIDTMARRGIAGRGVLLDIARHKQVDCRSSDLITPADLDSCAERQGVEVRAGDILLLRTGWLKWYTDDCTPDERAAMPDRAVLRAPGLGPAGEMAAWLWDHGVAAVAADNPALESWPPRVESGDFMHWRLIPLLGMPIGELWWLEDLADACAADGRYEFFLTSAPLNVPGGVGSPPNALAIK